MQCPARYTVLSGSNFHAFLCIIYSAFLGFLKLYHGRYNSNKVTLNICSNYSPPCQSTCLSAWDPSLCHPRRSFSFVRFRRHRHRPRLTSFFAPAAALRAWPMPADPSWSPIPWAFCWTPLASSSGSPQPSWNCGQPTLCEPPTLQPEIRDATLSKEAFEIEIQVAGLLANPSVWHSYISSFFLMPPEFWGQGRSISVDNSQHNICHNWPGIDKTTYAPWRGLLPAQLLLFL